MVMDSQRAIQEIARVTGIKHSDEQIDVLNHKGGMCILACAGSGKALKNGTGVLTPKGYIPIEDLKVGDECYGANGRIQTVEGVYPQGKKRVHEVVFENGDTAMCCEEHLWTYKIKGLEEGNSGWLTKTLKEMDLDRLRVKEAGGEIYIPASKPVQFKGDYDGENRVEHKIRPYTMGVLTGKGLLAGIGRDNQDNGESLSRVSVSSTMASWLNYELKEIGLRIENGQIVGPRGALKKELDRLGLLGVEGKDLYIHKEYKLASVGDRLDLLTGLLDALGKKRGEDDIIGATSHRLILDIEFVAKTLGFRTELAGQEGAYEIKIGSWGAREKLDNERGISEIIEKDEYSEMTCIKVSNANGLFLIDGCVVTHNTTVLTHLLAKRIMTGEIPDTGKLLCTTYSRAGSLEMGDRLSDLLLKLGLDNSVSVKTLHATYYQILRHFGLNSKVCTGSKRLELVTGVCRENGLRLENEDIQLVDSLLSYQVNNLMSDDQLVKSYVYTLEQVSLDAYSKIRLGYNAKKEKLGLLDFDDMQLYVYMLLVKDKNKAVLDYCRGLWTHFFIDEFQDISKIQFAILREMIGDHNNLIVIGDDDQCIYQWRGADPNIILNICGYYDIRPFVLSTNYRCGGEIVEHAAVGIRNNNRRSDKGMIPFNDGGRIRIADIGSSNLFDMTRYAVKHIKDTLNRGVQASDIAVLSRNNMHVSILINMLFKEGIHCSSVPEMRLTGSPIYRDLRDVLAISRGTYDTRLVARTAWRICMYLGTRGARMIANIMNTSGLSFVDTLGYIITIVGRGSQIKWDRMDKVKVPPVAREMIARSGMNDTAERGLVMIYNILTLSKNSEDKAKGLMDCYSVASEFMYKKEDRLRTMTGIVEYLKYLIDRDGFDGATSYLFLSSQYERGDTEVYGNRITMSTIHGAKGLEWKHVIMFADDNVTFPSFEGIQKMVRDEVSMSDISDSIDENRRLHYVAMTRAKDDLVILADIKNISVYTMEALGVSLNEGKMGNMGIIDASSGGWVFEEGLKKIHNMVHREGSRYSYRIELPSIGE